MIANKIRINIFNNLSNYIGLSLTIPCYSMHSCSKIGKNAIATFVFSRIGVWWGKDFKNYNDKTLLYLFIKNNCICIKSVNIYQRGLLILFWKSIKWFLTWINSIDIIWKWVLYYKLKVALNKIMLNIFSASNTHPCF